MVSFTVSTAIMALPLLASVASAKCSGRHSTSHRRHHAKIASAAQATATVALASGSQNAVQFNYGKPTAADPSALSSIWASKTSSGPQPTATSDVSDGEFPGISKNGIGFGECTANGTSARTCANLRFVPIQVSSPSTCHSKHWLLATNRDESDLVPVHSYKTQTLSQIDQGLGIKSSFYGWYAQLPQSGEWDGGQLLSIIDDVKKSGAIFQPAVMPNSNNWNGLTPDNNYQALAIARVMERFTSQGIEVWLRFAHEVNWYQTDGTYSGGVNEFKQAWAAVAAAVQGNPLVKMFYTPNIASGTDQYEAYFPDDKSTVDIIGIGERGYWMRMWSRHVKSYSTDYYPRSSSESFLEHVK